MITIRPAQPADIPAIIALERQTAASAHWTDAHYEALFDASAPRRVTLAAESPTDLALCGFVVALATSDEWEIENIVVALSHQRCGVGHHMVAALIAEARLYGAQLIRLEVRQSNVAAQRLYQKCGFQMAAERKNYYSFPVENAALFTLRLA